jgi:hypothetical protein
MIAPWKWRRPQKQGDVFTASILAMLNEAERGGYLDEMMARLDAQGHGDTAREIYGRAQLQREGVDCLSCGGEGPCVECGTDQLPPAGWYADPEVDGYVRYFSGTEWVGGPTDPAHVLGEDYEDEAVAGGYRRFIR